MTRTGKIARLPKAVREELNRRLLDGEQRTRLVDWLNEQEEVRAVLKADFEGEPISKANLSNWLAGGFEEWRQEQKALDVADNFMAETSALTETLARRDGKEGGGKGTEGKFLSDQATDMAALALIQQLMEVRAMERGAEKRGAVLKIVRGLVRLRQADRAYERDQREASAGAGEVADVAAFL
jgi:hypothetical protein